MSPRLPRPSTSERRISFTSALRPGCALATGRGGPLFAGRLPVVGLPVLGIARLGGRLEVAVTPRTPVTRWPRALRGHPTGVRQQRHLAGDLDRPGDLTLLL